MNELEKLALRHIKTIAENIGNEAIGLGRIISDKKFKETEHTYPIHGKANNIVSWIDAIIENQKK